MGRDFGNEGYVPPTGGGGARCELLSHNGKFAAVFDDRTAFVPQKKDPDAENLLIVAQVMDGDLGNEGKICTRYSPVTGEDGDGKNRLRQVIGTLLASRGVGVDKIDKFMASSPDDAKIYKQLHGKKFFFDAEAEFYNGSWSSKIQWIRTEEEYSTAKAAGVHRTKLPEGAQLQWNKENGKEAASSSDSDLDNDDAEL
jgi:hypothetical protein